MRPGGLAGVELDWDERAAVTVVLASRGYPASSSSGDVISGLDAVPADVEVTHAGTAARDGAIVTAGGRVLNVTALGATVGDARRAAYAAADMIAFDGRQLRRDIAVRGGEQRHQQVAVQPREQRLRLRVAESAVELEHHRPVVRPHQACKQDADKGRAALRQLLDHGSVDEVEDLLDLCRPVAGDRRVRAHPAGVRSGVAVPDPLEILCRRQRERTLTVAQREDRDLLALE